ncbi:MAG: type II toxin-antitoxin system PemK/MazF family toxin [Pseudonocardia sp.]
MRPIHLARLDEVRPGLVLTREVVRPYLRNVTVGAANGVDHDSVVSCDTITTVPSGQFLQQIRNLLPAQEPALAEAIGAAFDLDLPID